MTEPLRIIVAEDHVMVRTGLVEIINSFREFEVVAEVGTGAAAVASATRFHPDLMVLDLDMPDTIGNHPDHTARAVISASPKTQIVILTMHIEPGVVRDLLRAGVSGYLSKTAGPAELHGALTAAARGDDSICIEVPRQTLLGLSLPAPGPTNQLLSTREVEILTCVASGASNRDLARELYIAEATVKRHLDRIFKKLDVNSRIAAINRARELHLI